MKINIGKLLGTLARQLAPLIIAAVAERVTEKAARIGKPKA